MSPERSEAPLGCFLMKKLREFFTAMQNAIVSLFLDDQSSSTGELQIVPVVLDAEVEPSSPTNDLSVVTGILVVDISPSSPIERSESFPVALKLELSDPNISNISSDASSDNSDPVEMGESVLLSPSVESAGTPATEAIISVETATVNNALQVSVSEESESHVEHEQVSATEANLPSSPPILHNASPANGFAAQDAGPDHVQSAVTDATPVILPLEDNNIPPTSAVSTTDEAAPVPAPVDKVSPVVISSPILAKWVVRVPLDTIPRGNYFIVLIGSHPSLGEWNPARSVVMYPEGDYFVGNVRLEGRFSAPIEYKYAIGTTIVDDDLRPEAWQSWTNFNNRKIEIAAWESGENRMFHQTEHGGGNTNDEMRFIHWD